MSEPRPIEYARHRQANLVDALLRQAAQLSKSAQAYEDQLKARAPDEIPAMCSGSHPSAELGMFAASLRSLTQIEAQLHALWSTGLSR